VLQACSAHIRYCARRSPRFSMAQTTLPRAPTDIDRARQNFPPLGS
jgi:hypothetical protein